MSDFTATWKASKLNEGNSWQPVLEIRDNLFEPGRINSYSTVISHYFNTREACETFIKEVLMEVELNSTQTGWYPHSINGDTINGVESWPVYYKNGVIVYEWKELWFHKVSSCQIHIDSFLSKIVPAVLLEDNDG